MPFHPFSPQLCSDESIAYMRSLPLLFIIAIATRVAFHRVWAGSRRRHSARPSLSLLLAGCCSSRPCPRRRGRRRLCRSEGRQPPHNARARGRRARDVATPKSTSTLYARQPTSPSLYPPSYRALLKALLTPLDHVSELLVTPSSTLLITITLSLHNVDALDGGNEASSNKWRHSDHGRSDQ